METYISEAQALAICGGLKKLLPRYGQEIYQPQDFTKQYILGNSFSRGYYTMFRKNVKNDNLGYRMKED